MAPQGRRRRAPAWLACALLAGTRCTPLVGYVSAPDAASDALADTALDTAGRPCPERSGGASGTLDTVRSTPGVRDPRLGAFALVGALRGAQGRTYVYGYTRNCAGTDGGLEALVARVHADGRLDASFGDGGRVCVHRPGVGTRSDSVFQSMARDPAGRLVLVGKSVRVPNAWSGLVLRLDADGARDESFGAGGVRHYDALGAGLGSLVFYDLLAERDGIVLVGGELDPFRRPTYAAALRLRDDGAVDPAFHDGTLWVDPTSEVFSTLAPVPGGYVIAGTSRVGRRARLLRIDRAGRLVAAFGEGGVATHGGRAVFPRGLVLDARGGYVVGGALSTPGDIPFGLALQRFGPDGRADEAFGLGGTFVGTQTWDVGYLLHPVMTAQCDGRIVLTAHGRTHIELTRILPGGALDTAFGEGGVAQVAPLGTTRAALVDPDDGTLSVVAVSDGRGGDVVALWRVHP